MGRGHDGDCILIQEITAIISYPSSGYGEGRYGDMKTRAKEAAIPRRDRNFRVKIRQRQLPYKVYTTGTTL